MNTRAWLLLIPYVTVVVAANVMTDRMGLIPVGFGMLVTAGTFAAGLALLVRDFIQRYGGIVPVLVGIAAGSALSWFLATPALAVASCLAFTAAELADLLVFTRLRHRGFIKAAIASNFVSAPVDTVAFLAIAGFPLTVEAVTGQFVGKFVLATLVPVAIYAGVRRALLRKSEHAASA